MDWEGRSLVLGRVRARAVRIVRTRTRRFGVAGVGTGGCHDSPVARPGSINSISDGMASKSP